MLHAAACRRLEAKAVETPVNTRVLKLGKQEVEKQFLLLVEAHSEYIDVLRQSIEAAEHVSFMDAQEKRHYKALDEAEEVLFNIGAGEQPEEDKQEKKQEVESSALLQKKKVEKFVLEAEIPDMLASLKTISDEKMTSENFPLVKQQVEEVGYKLELVSSLTNELNLKEPAEAEKRNKELGVFLVNNKKLHNQVKINLMKNCPKQTQTATSALKVEHELPGRGAESTSRLQGLKLEAVSVPTFDGTARSYASFKKFWDDNMKSLTSSDQYAHLQKALAPEVKRNLSCVRKDATEVWEQLERMYGNSEVVAAAVMEDIWNLDARTLGNKFMGSFCVMLEDTETLLYTMGQTEWLTSSISIGQLEDKLPPVEQLRWAERMDTYEGRTRYDKFKRFLQERKEVEEKMRSIGSGQRAVKMPREESVKTGEKSVENCNFCTEKHSTENICRPRMAHCREKKLCFKWLEPMHGRSPCSWKPGQARPGPTASGRQSRTR